MNDLQDLIATNAIRAYNEGFERGVAAEQERIIAILDSLDIQFTCIDDRPYIVGDALDLIELIKIKPDDEI